MNPHALFGAELDAACAHALGWTLKETKNPEDNYYETDGKPVLVGFWKPTQSARQCQRLMLDHFIGVEHLEGPNVWRAFKKVDGKVVEAKAKRMHEAVCRVFVLYSLENIQQAPTS